MKPVSFILLLLCLLIGGIGFMIARSNGPQPDQNRPSDGSPQLITLNGATQFDENHAFTRTIRKFEQLVAEYYSGPVEFEPHPLRRNVRTRG